MTTRFERPIADWFAAHARDLPWRAPDAGSWAIMVSEFMLQQTPVPRVLPTYRAWLERWPTPAALAAATPADAVRQWDRLGYPRRAIRLHAAATMIADRHGGTVPASLADLRALPGVGDYTAAAVASFAFGQRHPVLDVNIRRVLARLVTGRDLGGGSVSVAEAALATSLLPPATDGRAARWNAAVMELGALLCTAARPACERCPVAAGCAWLARGRP
ncbi:MAG: HhH-GPD family protein, partial [Streptosporangiaceae bacterium]